MEDAVGAVVVTVDDGGLGLAGVLGTQDCVTAGQHRAVGTGICKEGAFCNENT